MVEDRSTKYFDCCRGGKPRSFEHVAGGVGNKATDLQAPVDKRGSNSAHQAFGCVVLAFLDGKVRYINGYRRVAFADEDNRQIIGFADRRDRIEVDRSSEYLALVVVGVVSAKFTAPRSGKEGGVFIVKEFDVRFYKLLVSKIVLCFVVYLTVQLLITLM